MNGPYIHESAPVEIIPHQNGEVVREVTIETVHGIPQVKSIKMGPPPTKAEQMEIDREAKRKMNAMMEWFYR